MKGKEEEDIAKVATAFLKLGGFSDQRFPAKKESSPIFSAAKGSNYIRAELEGPLRPGLFPKEKKREGNTCLAAAAAFFALFIKG